MKNEIPLLIDNPAYRLRSILTQVSEYEDYLPDELSGPVWARLFNVSEHPADFYPHYAQLFTLVNDSYKAVVHHYPKQKELHQSWKEYYLNTFQRMSPFHHKWLDVSTALEKPIHMNLVQVASDILSHHVNSETPNDISLKDLELKIDGLIQEITQSNELSDYLVSYLVAEFRKITSHLNLYNLYGSEPIKDSIYNIISNSEVQKPENSTIKTKIVAILSAVAFSIALVNDIKQLPSSIDGVAEMFLPNKGDTPREDTRKSTVASNKDDELEVDYVTEE